MLLLCAALLVHASFIYGFHNTSNVSSEQSIKYTNITGSNYKNNENSSSNSNKNDTVNRGITYGTTTTKLRNIIYGSTSFYESRRKTSGSMTESQRTAKRFLSSRDKAPLELTTLATISKKWQTYNSTLFKQKSNRSLDNTNKLPTTIKQMNFTDPLPAHKINITSKSSKNYSKEYYQSITTRKTKYSRRANRFRNFFSNVTTKSSFHTVPSSQQSGINYSTTTMKEESFNTNNQNFSVIGSITDSVSHPTGNRNSNTTFLSSYKSFFINSTSPSATFSKNVTKKVTELYYGPINLTTVHTNFESDGNRQLKETTNTLHNGPLKKTTKFLSEHLVPINESKFSVSEGIKNTKETITDAYMSTSHNMESDNNATSYTQSNFTLESTTIPSKASTSSQSSTRKILTTTETPQYLQSSLTNLNKNWTLTTNYLDPEFQTKSNISLNWTSTINYLDPGIQTKSNVSFFEENTLFNYSTVKSTDVTDPKSTVSDENPTFRYFNLSTVKRTSVSDSKSTLSEESTPIRYFNLSTIKSTSVSDSKSIKNTSSSVSKIVESTSQTHLKPSTLNKIEIITSSAMTTQITANNYNVTTPPKKCDNNCQKNEICVFNKRNKKQCICKPNFERDKSSKICKEVGYLVTTTASYYTTKDRANSDILNVTDSFSNQEEQNYWVYSFIKWNNLTANEKLYNSVTITFNEEVEALEWFKNFDIQFRHLISAMLRKANYTCKGSATSYNFHARNVVYIAPSPMIKNGMSAVSFIVEALDKNCTLKYVPGKLIKDTLSELNNGTMKMFQLYITSVDIGKYPEVISCKDNTKNALKLVITSVIITAVIASFLMLAILLIKCRRCNKFNEPQVHRYKTWDSKCAFATGNDLASDIQCVGDEADIVMECNGVKTGKVGELSKPSEKLSVLVHNEDKLELECSTSVKMKFKDKDDTKL